MRVTVIHDGGDVSVFRNGMLVSRTHGFQALDYSHAEAMVVGDRKGSDFWEGIIGPILIQPGIFKPGCGNGTNRLANAELSALKDIWDQCGGSQWKYEGTDVVGCGGRWMIGDPCASGWYGVKCDAAGEHVVQLFPNTRNSGNPLVCQLPASIGDLAHLEHLYTSNDETPSALQGSVPETLGNLQRLKCMYFSHNNLTQPFPRSLERLSNLQVFLSRANHIPGPLPDFGKFPKLRNVWFDGNQLEGDLTSLGRLTALTFLQATNNRLKGTVPTALCGIKCSAWGNNLTCPPALPRGCCGMGGCGAAAPAPAPPPASMGECFPQ